MESAPISQATIDSSSVVQQAGNVDGQLKKVQLDESLYKLGGDQAEFFKQQTRIVDDEDLKRHVLAVQKEAYDVCFSCIQFV